MSISCDYVYFTSLDEESFVLGLKIAALEGLHFF
jgi:hypothetical protein